MGDRLICGAAGAFVACSSPVSMESSLISESAIGTINTGSPVKLVKPNVFGLGMSALIADDGVVSTLVLPSVAVSRGAGSIGLTPAELVVELLLVGKLGIPVVELTTGAAVFTGGGVDMALPDSAPESVDVVVMSVSAAGLGVALAAPAA
jgi:hypothetical protein